MLLQGFRRHTLIFNRSALCVLLLMSLFTAALRAAESKVYLLSNFTIRGTPISKTLLLHEAEITRLEDCQAFLHKHLRKDVADNELYRHHIRESTTGVNLVPRYHCIESSLNISRWDDRAFYKYIYLIDLRDTPVFTRFEDTNSCWAAIRNEADKHSEQLFCGRLSQRISEN